MSASTSTPLHPVEPTPSRPVHAILQDAEQLPVQDLRQLLQGLHRLVLKEATKAPAEVTFPLGPGGFPTLPSDPDEPTLTSDKLKELLEDEWLPARR